MLHMESDTSLCTALHLYKQAFLVLALVNDNGQRFEPNFSHSVGTCSVDHRLFFGKHSETQRDRD